MLPVLAFLFGCSPLVPGLYEFTFVALEDNSCSVTESDFLQTDQANVTWDDEETLRIAMEGGDLVLIWDGEQATAHIPYVESVTSECDLVMDNFWTATPDGRRAFDLVADTTLEAQGSCGSHGEGLPCSFTWSYYAELRP